MKKVLLSISLAGLHWLGAFSQNDAEAVRYSQTLIGGDARFMGMAGAFGALGANTSCGGYNPAGLSVFRKGQISLSTGLAFSSVNATHYNSTNSDYKVNLNIPQTGIVIAFENKNNPFPERDKRHADWSQRFAIGVNYNRINTFAYNTLIESNVKNTSMIYDFVNVANGNSWQNLNGFYEGAAYQTYIINDLDTINNTYWGMIDPVYEKDKEFRQTKEIATKGRMGEWNISFAFAQNNRFYLGASLGIPRIVYDMSSVHTETDDNKKIAWFNNMQYWETLKTTATGVNLKVGAIYRVNEFMRIGAYAHTPTFFKMTDKYSSGVVSEFDSDSLTPSVLAGEKFAYGDTGYFSYTLNTPAKAGISSCFLLNKILAVNIDYEYLNYARANLRSSEYSFSEENKAIRKKYTATGNLRVGAELNLNPVMIRAGYAMYGSAFGEQFSGSFVKHNYCFGLGYRGQKSFFIDVALVFSRFKDLYYLYDPKLIEATRLRYRNTQFVTTVGFRF
jgi:hypothetical protein